jgi:hypothetical protein
LTLIQGNRCVYWSENWKIWNFSLKIIFLGVISCRESIARIPDPWKRFLDPYSEKESFIEAKIKHFRIFMRKPSGFYEKAILGFSRRGIDCAHSRSVKMLPWSWFREISTGWAKKVDFCDFWDPKIYFSKGNFMFLGVVLCGESIARISEPWKCIYIHNICIGEITVLF